MILYLHGFRSGPASHKAQLLKARMTELGLRLVCPQLPIDPRAAMALCEELLDYRQAVSKYAGSRQTVLAGGDHSFTRWTDYLDDIIRFAGEIGSQPI